MLRNTLIMNDTTSFLYMPNVYNRKLYDESEVFVSRLHTFFFIYSYCDEDDDVQVERGAQGI